MTDAEAAELEKEEHSLSEDSARMCCAWGYGVAMEESAAWISVAPQYNATQFASAFHPY